MANSSATDDSRIRIVRTAVFEGPSQWAAVPVVLAEIDASKAGADGAQRLFAMMTSADPTLPAVAGSGEGIRSNVGSIIAGIALQMQEHAGDEVAFSASRPTAEPGMFDVAIEYHQLQLAMASLDLTVRMLNALLFHTERHFDPQAEFEREILDIVRRRSVRPQEDALFKAARRSGIPIRWVAPPALLIELGTGIHMRRYRNMISSKSSYIGNTLTSHKALTLQMLREVGLPVPRSIVVRTDSEALLAADDIGYPVVLKPNDGSGGRGLCIDIRTPAKVRESFSIASRATEGRSVLVEEMIAGREHRILVMGGKVVAVAERMPAHVTGDGEHTIRELIAITNTDPLRGRSHTNIMSNIELDAATTDALERVGKTLESIPSAGEYVRVKLASNMSQGGTSRDRTDDIHPENARVAVLAARTLDVEICGVDMIILDITQPIWEVGGAIIELNREPGARLHLRPQHGVPRDLGQAVIDSLYPADSPVRIPVVAVCGDEVAEKIACLIARIVQASGRTTGLTTTTVNAIGRDVMARPDLAGRTHHQLVLRNPYAEIAVLQVESRDFEAPGLGFDQCDVAVLAEPLETGGNGLRSAEEVLISIIGLDGAVVLDADHDQFEALLPSLPASSVLFSQDSDSPRMRSWVSEGGRAVFLRDGQVMALDNSGERLFTECAPDVYSTSAFLASAACAVAMEIPAGTIAAAISGIKDQQE